MIADKKSKHKFCTEPNPDSTESFSEGLSVNPLPASNAKGISADENIASGSLGGRNGTVLLAREILFRVCEMGVNYNASYEQQVGLFVRALESIEKLGDEGQASGPVTQSMSSSNIWKNAPSRVTSSATSDDDDDSSDDD